MPWFRMAGSRGGRAPQFAATDALGLVLHWLLSPSQEKLLSMIFGAVASTLNVAKNRALEALELVLRAWRPGRIAWPTVAKVHSYGGGLRVCGPAETLPPVPFLPPVPLPSEMQITELARLAHRREHRTAHTCFAVIDGLNLPIKSSGDPEMQNAFYNG